MAFNSKQGFVELYTQRLIEGNICGLRPHRLRLSWPKPSGLRLSRLKLCKLKLSRLRSHRLGLSWSEAGGWGGGGVGGVNKIIYSSMSRKYTSILMYLSKYTSICGPALSLGVCP